MNLCEYANLETLNFEPLLGDFSNLIHLQQRIRSVLQNLPNEIQLDFLNDPYFRISVDDCEPGKGRTVLMPLMNPSEGESRCVVLKPKLETASEDFALYIIAHEFAHSVLRNGGWGEITDREEAADALAASWGYERPAGKLGFWW